MKLKHQFHPITLLFFLLLFLAMSSAIHMRKGKHTHQKVLHRGKTPPSKAFRQDTSAPDSNGTISAADNGTLAAQDNGTNLTNSTNGDNNTNTSIMVDIMMCPFLMNLTNGIGLDNLTALLANFTDTSTSNASVPADASSVPIFKEKKQKSTRMQQDNATTATPSATNDTNTTAVAGDASGANTSGSSTTTPAAATDSTNTAATTTATTSAAPTTDASTAGTSGTAASGTTTTAAAGDNSTTTAAPAAATDNSNTAAASTTTAAATTTATSTPADASAGATNTAGAATTSTTSGDTSATGNAGSATPAATTSNSTTDNSANGNAAASTGDSNAAVANNTTATVGDNSTSVGNNNSDSGQNNGDNSTNSSNLNSSTNNGSNNSFELNITGPNGETLERVEFVRKLSPYAQVEYHEREKPEYRTNFMIGKPLYVENNITYDETPNIFDKVVSESLTGVVTPVIPKTELWKNFNNKVFKPVPFGERLEPMELTESPVIKTPVNIEIRKVTVAKKPKTIDSQLLTLANPIKPQVYGNKYDSVINLDTLPTAGEAYQARVISHTIKKKIKLEE